ncbi:hypothetical protein [Bradyrhizobium nanningense]|uniref:hypothetical protein n=1 Tax=Bradyrhizobium nanningense TaxID=1325118 RepID=UPI001008B310|nr:hypothetical protein [Bradyrhizobium nanningense]
MLSVAEDAALKNTGERDHHRAAADEKIRASLLLNPSDSFLWFVWYSLKMSVEGFDERSLRYLEFSYASAPLEAWIALRRNSVGLAVLPLVGEEARQRILLEFAALVDGGFHQAAAINLTGVGWSERVLLLSTLTHVDIIAREAFARVLAREGVKVSVPGVQTDERVWR